MSAFATSARSAEPFEYKGDRPGFTTFARFEKTHGTIYDEAAKHDALKDQNNNVYEADAAVTCTRPVKNGAYVGNLRDCFTRRHMFSNVPILIDWQFVDDVLAYMSVEFPKNDFNDTVELLRNKYGKPTSTTHEEITADGNGSTYSSVVPTWQRENFAIIGHSVSKVDVFNDSTLEISDKPLHHRYKALSSTAAI